MQSIEISKLRWQRQLRAASAALLRNVQRRFAIIDVLETMMLIIILTKNFSSLYQSLDFLLSL